MCTSSDVLTSRVMVERARQEERHALGSQSRRNQALRWVWKRHDRRFSSSAASICCGRPCSATSTGCCIPLQKTYVHRGLLHWCSTAEDTREAHDVQESATQEHAHVCARW
jgi:hypothetical protein